MFHQFTKLMCLSVVTLLTGCCGIYKFPEGAPTAIVDKQNLGFMTNTVIIVGKDDCSSGALPTTYPFRIEADKVQTLLINTVYHQNQYSFYVSFMPKPNAYYLVNVDYQHSGESLNAKLTLINGKAGEKNSSLTPFVQRDSDGTFLNSCNDKNLGLIRENKFSEMQKVTEKTISEPDRSGIIFT